MRLLAHVHKYPPEHNAGAEWMLHAIARHLIGTGWEVDVFGSHVKSRAVLDGVRIHPRTSTRHLEELYAAADVVVTHLDETRRAIAHAHRHGKPIAHLIHNDRQIDYHGISRGDADLVVYNSRWIAEASSWEGRSIVVRPPVSVADYATEHDERRVTLLNLAEAKGGPLFFELARRLPDVDFLGVLGAYARQEIPSPVPPNVELVANTPDVVRDVYRRTAVLLVPSRYESFGRVAVEASSSGIPVVAHPTPGLLESLGPSGIFVDRDDVEGYAAEIRRLLDDPEHYAERSTIARARALELDPASELELLDLELRRLVELRRLGTVDFAAHTVAYVEHLAPIYRALPEEARGRFFVSSWARDRALDEGIPEADLEVDDSDRLPPGAETVVASYRDLTRARGRLVILAEHGAGQSYSNRHSSYVGGVGREDVKLFVVPSEQAAARNRKRYPKTPNAVVGSPRVDRLLELEREPGPPTVAISFHWRCTVTPEAGTALDHYRPILGELRAGLEAAGVRLIGHAHPGIAGELEPIYLEEGIEFVPAFVDVVRRADLYAVDNSSTLFEFAALDRPVVVLNSPRFRRNVRHGLRFWTEADVGLQVDDPGELLAAILKALDDPPELAGSRRAAVGRAYAVTDGSSAARAAEAIVTLLGRPPRCLVCGAAHASCGPKTTVVPIDQRTKEPSKMAGPLKKYPNPARAGAFLKLSDEDAKRLGLLGTDVGAARSHAAPVDVTNPGGDPLVRSGPAGSPESSSESSSGPDAAENASSASPGESGPPPGALAPGGPTHRARAEAASSSVDAEDELEDDVDEPKKASSTTKKTSSRRRRKPAEG